MVTKTQNLFMPKMITRISLKRRLLTYMRLVVADNDGASRGLSKEKQRGIVELSFILSEFLSTSIQQPQCASISNSDDEILFETSIWWMCHVQAWSETIARICESLGLHDPTVSFDISLLRHLSFNSADFHTCKRVCLQYSTLKRQASSNHAKPPKSFSYASWNKF